VYKLVEFQLIKSETACIDWYARYYSIQLQQEKKVQQMRMVGNKIGFRSSR